MTGAYIQEVAADSPLIYLRLGEASGLTAVDSSVNNRNGTYYGTPGYGADSLLPGDIDNKAINFSSDDYVEVPYGAYMNTSAFTIEAMIKPNTLSGIQTIMSRYGGGFSNSAFTLRLDENKISFIVFSGNNYGNAYAAISLVLATSYHVVATYDGATARIYVNGQLDKTQSMSASNAPVRALRVGRNGDNGEQFLGIIDEPAYYGTALTASRILEHYSARSIGLADSRTTGNAPVTSITSSVSSIAGTSTTGTSPVTVESLSFVYMSYDFEPYPGDDPKIRLPFDLAGVMTPDFPPPSPPTDFSGLTNPTIAPTVTISTTVDGTLLPGTYRYSYAAWKGSPAQATAPSPSVEITLTTENTVSVAPVSIFGADGYLIYREDL